MKLIVTCKNAYSPQNYVETVTGKCHLFQADSITEVIAEIQYYLSINGYHLQNYPLPELKQVLESKADVVLVELAGTDNSGEWESVYHWFEVPK